MSREKSPRPTTLTEALDKLKDAKNAFYEIMGKAISEAETGNLQRAELLIKEGHGLMLGLKDVYNRAYGAIQSASHAEKAKAEKPAKDKAEKPATTRSTPEPKAGDAGEDV